MAKTYQMAGDSSTKKSAEERFWRRFVDRVRTNGVKEAALRWHVRRAEAYLTAFSGKRLGWHTREDVTGYLAQAGRIGRIVDWQFAQIVDAIRNLRVTARAPVAAQVDWGFWRDSARNLAPDRPTIARKGSHRCRLRRATMTPRPTGTAH